MPPTLNKYIPCLVMTVLLLALVPAAVLANHVSLGRWHADGCYLGEELEIYHENRNYAISIKDKNSGHTLIPLQKKADEDDGRIVFECSELKNGQHIIFEIQSNKHLKIHSKGKPSCSGEPFLIKKESSLY